MNLIVIHHRFL